MATHQMTIARASKSDFDNLLSFLHIAEAVLERPRYGYGEPGGDWEQWDEDDEDKIELLEIRDRLAKEEIMRPEDIDNRLVFYTILRRRFAAASSAWRRVHAMAVVWEENAQNPTDDVLSWLPGLEYQHVANEQ